MEARVLLLCALALACVLYGMCIMHECVFMNSIPANEFADVCHGNSSDTGSSLQCIYIEKSK